MSRREYTIDHAEAERKAHPVEVGTDSDGESLYLYVLEGLTAEELGELMLIEEAPVQQRIPRSLQVLMCTESGDRKFKQSERVETFTARLPGRVALALVQEATKVNQIEIAGVDLDEAAGN